MTKAESDTDVLVSLGASKDLVDIKSDCRILAASKEGLGECALGYLDLNRSVLVGRHSDVHPNDVVEEDSHTV